MKKTILLLPFTFFLSCGESGSLLNENLAVTADNVLFSASSASKLGIIQKVHAAELDSNVQVLASNVLLTAGASRLSSANLQAALDEEIAVNLASNLVGTWTIENKSIESLVNGKTGTLTFTSTGATTGTFTISSRGVFAAAGMVPTNADACLATGTPTYELLGDSVLYVNFVATRTVYEAVISVVSMSNNQITLVGGLGCAGGASRVSILTRVS